jgi:hypothetical protein
MSGCLGAGPRSRAASTDLAKAAAVAEGVLARQAASI